MRDERSTGEFVWSVRMKLLTKFIDDILFLIGCGCIVYGLSMWNVVVTWIVAGILLIVFSVMVGKAKARHDTE